jgi:hypothetical protein
MDEYFVAWIAIALRARRKPVSRSSVDQLLTQNWHGLGALETADIGKKSFGAEDCTLSEKELTYGVPFTAKSAGEIKMTGKTNFSVCNERTCKLYRGEKVAWTVTAK